MNKFFSLFKTYDEKYPYSDYRKSEILEHFKDYPKFAKFFWFLLQRQYDVKTIDDSKHILTRQQALILLNTPTEPGQSVAGKVQMITELLSLYEEKEEDSEDV